MPVYVYVVLIGDTVQAVFTNRLEAEMEAGQSFYGSVVEFELQVHFS